MRARRDTSLGMALIIGSAFAYSLSGFFTHLIEQDVWTVLFWRGLFGGLFIGGYVIWIERSNALRAIHAMGNAGIAVMTLSTLATICFISALRLAPVGEVMTIHAAIPFLTALLGLMIGGDREKWFTWVASFIALAGVSIMVNPSASRDHMSGYFFGAAMAASYAAMMIIIRKNRQVSMLPAAALSAFLCTAIVLPFAKPFAVSSAEMGYLVLFGTIQFGLGLLLMTLGTRLISATSSALIGSLENPLAPLWVWLAFAERPTVSTWIGGTIVMLAVIGDVIFKSQQTARPRHQNPLETQ